MEVHSYLCACLGHTRHAHSAKWECLHNDLFHKLDCLQHKKECYLNRQTVISILHEKDCWCMVSNLGRILGTYIMDIELEPVSKLKWCLEHLASRWKINEFRCYETKIEENENAGSCWNSNPVWATSALHWATTARWPPTTTILWVLPGVRLGHSVPPVQYI